MSYALFSKYQIYGISKQKKPHYNSSGAFKKGGDILSRYYSVPSALIGLTSLFGMGRGDPYRYNHHKLFVLNTQYLISKEEKYTIVEKI
uniref:Uncharacterized protein n=1 Tax=uncultured Sphingobacteriales bacterium HF0010_19H17 TaxID=710990 RepID=E0XRD5_9SPHI|nr:hypothetical protein [uncultured Sphingobacteriales bacterium HF0010_19H17]